MWWHLDPWDLGAHWLSDGAIVPSPDSLKLFRRALRWYALATAILAVGVPAAAVRYPGSFDWAYTVISALASRKHNPDGAAWFAGAIAGAMACLWPVVTQLTRDGAAPRWVQGALRTGVVCGVFVGLERLVFYHLVRKGHELVALVSFLAFYPAVLGLYAHRVRQRRGFLLPAVIAVVPLLGVGVREFYLYLAQRGIGWTDYDWHGHGAPLWLSFALWQWLAAVLLWLAVGHLLVTSPRSEGPEH
jgi:hypothetical protein